jgi:hypothetical protein
LRIAKPTFCTCRRFVKQNECPGKILRATSAPSISCNAMTSADSVAAKAARRAKSGSLQRPFGTRSQGIARSLPPGRASRPKQAGASASKTAGVIIHSRFQVATVSRSAAPAAIEAASARIAVASRVTTRAAAGLQPGR